MTPSARLAALRRPGTPMVALTPELRRERQNETLQTPERPYGIDARVIFWLEDRAWGTERTLSKFKARELVARSPYRAWAHSHAGDAADVVQEANERSHWNILRELLAEDRRRDSTIRFGLLPLMGAAAMYAWTWSLSLVRPSRSFRLNADIEDHAEHEYAELVAEHPEWDRRPYTPAIAEYGSYESRADALRQIGCDERAHKELSIERSATAGRP